MTEAARPTDRPLVMNATLAALLALGAGELREEVLVDATEDVLGAALLVADPDVADEVDQLSQPQLLIGILGVGTLRLLGHEPGVLLLEKRRRCT